MMYFIDIWFIKILTGIWFILLIGYIIGRILWRCGKIKITYKE